MMENPAFDENLLQKNNYIYKVVKPKIDKEKVKEIPGMKELWQEISKVESWIKQNQGEEPFQEGTPRFSQKQLYYYQHLLIDIRTQQYYLADSYLPAPIQAHENRFHYFTSQIDQQMNYPVFPRGVMREENDENFKNPRTAIYNDYPWFSDQERESMAAQNKLFFDFSKPEHLYQLIQHYEEIQVMVENQPDSLLNNLIWTLDFYIEKANLNEQQILIVEGKKKRLANKEIAKKLLTELGIYHQENYISTIWNKVVKLICAAVELNYDEFLARNYDKAWKICNRCGRELLRDSRNFVKKAKSSDGLTSRCKFCDKELRQAPKKILVGGDSFGN